MRYYGMAFIALASLVGAFAQANGPHYDRVGYRYKVHYRDFDHGFNRTYGYNETCYSNYTWADTRSTCFNVDPDSDVFVQEQIYTDSATGLRYNRVSVFHDQDGRSPIVYYNIYGAHDNRRVVYRNWHDRDGYYGEYPEWRDRDYEEGECYGPTVVVYLDWNQWQTKEFVGAFTQLIGVDFLLTAIGDKDPVTGVVGVALLVLGGAKKKAGAKQHASELQQGIADAQKNKASQNQEHLD